MSGRGKRYAQASELADREREHTPADAIKALKEFPDAKFDETVEIAFRLGVDPRKADQLVRGTVTLPNGSGKSMRVAVFAVGPKATEAKDAGADLVGGEELVEQVMGGEIDFDAAVATPAPPVGTALGQHGVNIMEFCRQYNEQTQSQAGQVIPAELTIYEDRSFSFITKQPPAAELIKQAAGVDKGSGEPNREKVGRLTQDQVRRIAEQKMVDLNANDVDAAMKIVEGTARSMGVEVSV